MAVRGILKIAHQIEIAARFSLLIVSVQRSVSVSEDVLRVLREGENKEEKLRQFLFELAFGKDDDDGLLI